MKNKGKIGEKPWYLRPGNLCPYCKKGHLNVSPFCEKYPRRKIRGSTEKIFPKLDRNTQP